MRNWVNNTLKSSIYEIGQDNLTELLHRKHLYAILLKDQGNYEEACLIFNECLEKYLTIRDNNELNIADTYGNLAIIYQIQHKYDESLDLNKKALETYLSQENSKKISIIYNNMAIINNCIGKYDDSIMYHNKCLDIYKSLNGDNFFEISTSYHNIACVYDNQGYYEKSLTFFNLALTIRIQKLGKNHPDVADTHHNMGNVYSKQENYNESFKSYTECLKIYSEKFGNDHPNVLKIQNIIETVSYSIENFRLIDILPNEVMVMHHQHKLIKLSRPIYPGPPGYYCNICSKFGIGCVYSCFECSFDCHPQCVCDNDLFI